MEVHEDFVAAPQVEPSSRNRVITPERPRAVRRKMDGERGEEAQRLRISPPDKPEEAIDDDGDGVGPVSPLAQWYADPGAASAGDSAIGELSIVDGKILAACILNVDITEVYSPTRVNAVAAKFGLVPGNSLDLTNGWNFDLQEHRNKAWAMIAKTKPYLLIG